MLAELRQKHDADDDQIEMHLQIILGDRGETDIPADDPSLESWFDSLEKHHKAMVLGWYGEMHGNTD